MYQHSKIQVCVLAAGKGTRMKSLKPKVLHSVLGKPMLAHVLHTVESLRPQGVSVVIGYETEQIKQEFGSPANLDWVVQDQQLGTGHAVLQCEKSCALAEQVLIVCGDTPLLRKETLNALIENHEAENASVSVLTTIMGDPDGYGRVCRQADGSVMAIVEHRDASDEQLKIKEVNTGIFCVRKNDLFTLLHNIECENDQNEYYLPDIISLALSQRLKVNAMICDHANETLGINDRLQLSHLEGLLQNRITQEWQRQGVTVSQPETVRIEATVSLGADVEIKAGCQLIGATSIGDGCVVGPYTVIEDSWVDDHVHINAFSHLQGAHVGSKSKVGPFARLRPEAKLDEHVHIGNFVEVKKSVIGKGSKVNHLSYIGDTEMGEKCNIGAGSITCNYDGANKHKTVIGNEVFVGSDTKLVAPVEVKSGATIGAGSIITKTVNENGLTLSARPEQRHVKEWQRPKKDA